ncbi:hypothetical protein ACT4UT_27350, partial [Bacillus sp. B-TM1]
GGVFLPYFQENGWDGNVTSVIFASLVTTDKQSKPVPDLAEKWDISADQLTYTFQPFSWKYGRKTPPGLEMAVIKVSFR